MRLKKSIVNIGKSPCTVVQFNYTPPKDEDISKNRIHFVQVLDRSGSMAPYIDRLIENVKKTVNVMSEDDLLTVIWFSGPGEYKVLLKGASPGDINLKNQLDKLKSTLGTTCFSEALKEAKEVVEDLSDLCPNFVVSLFTDGQPVVPWSIKEEESRTKNILIEMKDKILSFNTIGYSGGYNIVFLKELASLSKFGRHAHSTMIDEYLPIFSHNLRLVENISPDIVEIKSPSNSILYLNRRTSKIDKDKLKVNLSAKSVNKFYIINPSCEEFKFEVNEESYDSSKIKCRLTEKDIENLLYALAYEEYYKGNTSGALDILMLSLRDRYLIKSVLSSFTARERQRCSDTLLSAARNVKINIKPRLWGESRNMEGQINEGEIIEDGPCFMELLEVFEKNGDKFIPLASEKYRRIGKKVMDHYNAFRIDKSRKLTAEFKDLVFTKEKLNISIRYEIPGFVIINPRQAKSAGLKTNSFSAKVYREQTIIKDGDINIDRFQALVSKNTLKYLESLKVRDLFKKAEKNEYPYEGFSLIEMNIAKLPVLNEKSVTRSDSLDYILDTVYEQRCAECKQKVLKYYLERIKRNTSCGKMYFTRKQHELLQSFGLTPDGIYQGIDNRVVKESNDAYECRFFEFGIKGFSTIPKVEEVIAKMEEGSKKMNGPETIVANAVKYIRKKGIETRADELNKLLDRQKEIIRTNTRTLAVIKLAKALSGGWWTGLKLDSKDNYLYERQDNTLVIRVIRKIVQI